MSSKEPARAGPLGRALHWERDGATEMGPPFVCRDGEAAESNRRHRFEGMISRIQMRWFGVCGKRVSSAIERDAMSNVRGARGFARMLLGTDAMNE